MNDNNKESAVRFLEMIIAGNIDEAYERYIDMGGKHHNAYFPAGFASLKKAMKENHAQFPDKQMEVKHILADGDLVAVHSHVVLEPGKTELAVVHLLRFGGDKIVEMWDCGQMIGADIPNKDGFF